MDRAPEIDLAEAKAQVFAYCKKRGALAVGIADVELLERVAPPGHGPRALMPRVRAVVSIGVGGGTQGAWAASAKTMSFCAPGGGGRRRGLRAAAHGLWRGSLNKMYQHRWKHD